MLNKICTIENDQRDLIITLTMGHPQPIESATLLVGYEFVCQNPQIAAGEYFWTLEVMSNGKKVILATEQTYIVQRQFPKLP